ncbi:MAG: 1,4-alpha-glucan branching protein GlgB [Candidatus Omnitrophica bacterium]|nr:1,4-alpha-glucan branching protein GlgB [Candidatus Omnitrophota bacterium]
MINTDVVHGDSLFSDDDIYLFREGNHFGLYGKMGARLREIGGVDGVNFVVWAPNAERVSVIGDFNGWDKERHPLALRWDGSGLWEGFIPAIGQGERYKYHIVSRHNGYRIDKGDPYALFWEISPGTASRIWDISYDWKDASWMEERKKKRLLSQPVSVYEMHLGSWRRVPEDGRRSLTYRETADLLVPYLLETGFTHVEFLPLTEHPFYGSWGYQTVGYFAPTSRYGTPQEFMYLIDSLHGAGIGVIMDWVPSHFPQDAFGLAYFDGTHLYEHEDPRQGFHPDWKSGIFNFGRREVRNFLISSAAFWLDKYHIDALRVDAVASMLYLDYSRQDGSWVANAYGGKENIEAIELIKTLNSYLYKTFPGIEVMAEESTAWPMCTKPVYVGGLGFGYKWNMGWAHDILEYMSKDPMFRKFHQGNLIFSLCYAFSENFINTLSHDEVVYGKRSFFNKMPGDDWQRFANLRVLLGYMFAHPGKKLMFMGAEFGVWSEWDHENSLSWDLIDNPGNKGLKKWVSDLNFHYRGNPALFESDATHDGFRWVDANDQDNSVLSFLRRTKDGSAETLIVCNFTPLPRHGYRIGVPESVCWNEELNSDAVEYGGSGVGNYGRANTESISCHGRPVSICVTLPPLSVTYFSKCSEA